MGGAGGSGEGPILDSQYDIKTETFNINNHWHLNFGKVSTMIHSIHSSDLIWHPDEAALDRFLRQMADSGTIPHSTSDPILIKAP